MSRLVYELLRFYNRSGEQFGFIDSPLHDLCAVEYLLKPELFNGRKCYVDVVTDEGEARGLTFADERRALDQEKHVLVLEAVDRDRFVEVLMEALRVLDGRLN